MIFAVLSKPGQDALRAIGVLAAETVKLVLSSRVVLALPVVLPSLVHIDTLVQGHDLGQMVLLLVALVHSDVALVAEVSVVVLAIFSSLTSAGYAVLYLRK